MGPGFQVAIIVWDFNSLEMLYRVRYHKEAIIALSFSFDEKYLLSLGCKNDGNEIVCWNMEEGRSECAQPATNQEHQECTDICFYNTRRDRFVSAHDGTIKFWGIDEDSHKFQCFDCKLAQNKRYFTCLAIDESDTFLYAGSRTGDVVILNISTCSYRRTGPVEKIFSGGINSINAFFNDFILIGAVNGYLAKINKKTMLLSEEVQLGGGPIVSMTRSKEKVYACTSKGSLHSCEVSLPLASQVCFMTSQSEAIGEIIFPAEFSEVFATRSKDQIRIWNVSD